ncbi:MAG: hypothetical protein WC466_09435 [Candidatus Izemoplasmatales bacterium]
METIIKFDSKKEFANYVEQKAQQVINENKIESLGISSDLEMNKMDKTKDNQGAQVNTDGKIKKDAPQNTPKEFETTKDPVDVNMEERDEGWDEEIATAAKIEGTKSEKQGTETNPHIKGQPKADVVSKKNQPNLTTENDPTKEGGVSGDKENNTEMNKEDKEDNQTVPKTQVIGKGEITKDGFSKGQTDKEINVEPKQEIDTQRQKNIDAIKTIQLPESFKNKKEMSDFIKKEAIRISKII